MKKVCGICEHFGNCDKSRDKTKPACGWFNLHSDCVDDDSDNLMTGIVAGVAMSELFDSGSSCSDDDDSSSFSSSIDDNVTGGGGDFGGGGASGDW